MYIQRFFSLSVPKKKLPKIICIPQFPCLCPKNVILKEYE